MTYEQRVDLIRYFRRFDGHGNGLIIKGRVRSGKTYLASIITRMLVRSGFVVISNLRFKNEVYDNYPDQIYYIKDDIGFFTYYSQIDDGRPIVLVWDDAQAQEGFKSTGVMSEQGKKLASFLIFIGKFEASYIFIAHQKYIPDCIVEGFDPLVIYKFNRQSFVLAETLYDSNRDVYHDKNAIHVPVPKPELNQHLPILSRGIAGFKFKMDLPDLYEYLGRYEVGENLKQAVTEYLLTRLDETQGKYDELKSLSFKDIYISLCMKKGKVLSDGLRIRDLVNPRTLTDARKLLREMGYK